MTDNSIRLTLRAQDIHRTPGNPTAAELAAALTFAHRVLNRVTSDAYQTDALARPSFNAIREEPSAVNFEITSASNGSVVLEGILAVAGNPFVQGIAGGIIANIATPRLLAAAEKTKGLFRRPAKASAGRTVQLELAIDSSNVKVEVKYLDDGKTRIKVQVQRVTPPAPTDTSDA